MGTTNDIRQKGSGHAMRGQVGNTEGAGGPEDIADIIVFLATDDARHSIGQLMHVNGGDYLA